jgi:hypothetical protein
VEVNAMKVHQVNRLRVKHMFNQPSQPPANMRLMRRVDPRQLRPTRDECASRFRTVARYHGRPVPCLDQLPLEFAENLLGAADRIGTDRRKRVCNE